MQANFILALLFFCLLCFGEARQPEKGCVKKLNVVRNSRVKRQAQCIDNATNCPQFIQYCFTPQYVNCMSQNCRQTCRFCTPPQVTTTQATTVVTVG